MKSYLALVLILQAGLSAARSADIADHHASARVQVPPGALGQIVIFIKGLEASILEDDKAERSSYDKFACWCEDMIKTKGRAIEKIDKQIAKLTESITHAGAEVAALKAMYSNIKTTLKANIESQGEATDLRNKENADYTESITQFEAAIKALEEALKVLDGAGTGKKQGFLETLQEAQVLGVVAGVRNVLKSPLSTKKLSADEIKVVDEFVDKPEDFLGNRMPGFSAAQIAHNPFGDYAPQSTRIQGIMKTLITSLEDEMKAAIEEEEKKKEDFTELMQSKSREQTTLQKTLEVKEVTASSTAALLSSEKSERDDLRVQKHELELFFGSTKGQCTEKAKIFSERQRLRTEELMSIHTAINILSNDEAKATFKKSSETLLFLQLRAKKAKASEDRRQKAYVQLKKIATQFNSMALAQIAAEVTTGGIFDKVMVMIDKMMVTLEEEAENDRAQLHLCEMGEKESKAMMADLEHSLAKAGSDLERAQAGIKATADKIKELDDEIEGTKGELKALADNREDAIKAFQEALKADEDSIALINKAVDKLREFYKKNNMDMGLLQKQNMTETKMSDKPPETSWTGAYEGKGAESNNIVAILQMIREDTVKEVESLKEDEAADETTYLKQKADLKETLLDQESMKILMLRRKAKFEEKEQDLLDEKDGKKEELSDEEGKKEAQDSGCGPIKEKQKSRKAKREMEMEGLKAAKNFLAGVTDDF